MAHENPHLEYATGFDDLVSVVESVEHPGSFFIAAAMTTPMPWLQVEDAGTLSFPLPAEQCRRLIETVATKAPYGRGGETLLDESVRKVRQIGAEQISLGGVAWAPILAELLARVAAGLGVPEGAIEAQLYKLLIYEPGGFFHPHRDSEKAGGMFGTLVVALPSAHTGGLLRIRHLDEATEVDLCNEDPGLLKFAAFYADCEHEVLPIESGYRVCLVFNLIHKPARGHPGLAAPDHHAQIGGVADILGQWITGAREGPEKLVWLLDHRYTSAGLSLERLKSQDAAIARVLRRAAERAGCAFHLGIVHVEESGWAEYTGDYGYSRRGRRGDSDYGEDAFSVGEVCDARQFIDSWRDVEDRPVEFGEIPLQDEEALPPGVLDGEEADEKHFTEATGNEGASFERTYLRAACVLWPADRTDEICLSAGIDAGLGLLKGRVKAWKGRSAPSWDDGADALVTFASKLIARWDGGTAPGRRLSRLLMAIGELNHRIAAEALPVEFLATHYTGAQNSELLCLLLLLDESAARSLARAVIEENAWRFPAAGLDLGVKIVGQSRLRFLSEDVFRSLLETLPARRIRKKTSARAWSGIIRDEPKAPVISPQLLRDFLAAIQASPCPGVLGRACAVICDGFDYFTPEEIMVPMLELLATSGPDLPPAPVFFLWEATARYFLERSEHPPMPPPDWAMPVHFPENDPLLRELAWFVRSPDEAVHHFRLRADLRQRIHQALDQYCLDITHVTDRRGSPYTLVCRKTLKSYQAACAVYRSDLALMEQLAALPPATLDVGGPCKERMVAALDRFAGWSPATEPVRRGES